ncbi:MFS transporter [Streptomyces sp. NPDC050560]|uniref:MFS transporter n=1 Tax=Streptomyces sp. NPDC050560 TaxID=3365630 RepID=UPI00379DA259
MTVRWRVTAQSGTDQAQGRAGRGVGSLGAATVFAVGMAGTTLPTPLYGLYREEIGFSELIVTVIFAVYALGVIAVLLLAGDVSDRTGRRPVLLAALVFSAGSALCFLLESGLPLMFLGRVLSGFAAGLLSGAGTAAVLELAGPGRTARAGLAATAANMGGLGSGPLLSGLLAQYAPWPLRLPYLVHLALVCAVALIVWRLPETVRTERGGARALLRPSGMRVPPEVRGVFTPAACAAFAGFALLGLFTSVSSGFITGTLGESNLAVAGAVVFTVFLASTAGQSLMPRLGVARALPAGCLLLLVGLLLAGLSLLVKSLWPLVACALVGGAGQGLGFRAGLTAVSGAAPARHRAGAISAFFVVAYLGISVPSVGVGAISLALGLREAGMVFTAVVMLLTAAVGAYVWRRPLTPAPA